MRDVNRVIEHIERIMTRNLDVTVTARAIKISAPLDPAAVGALPIPDGERTDLAVNCDGKLYTASVATKSFRKVKTAIAANGAENMFVMIQGKLKGSEIIEAGLTAQVKAKPQELSLS
jgi:hypothetical protein